MMQEDDFLMDLNLSGFTYDCSEGDSDTVPVIGNDCDITCESNDELSDVTLKSENTNHSILDENIGKCKPCVNSEDELDLSFSGACHDDENDGNMNSSVLSLEVSASEFDNLEVNTEDIADISENLLDLHVLVDHKSNGLKSSESRLHCAICDNFFSMPKLLKCLHTFCLACLQKDFKKTFTFLFCPLCATRTDIPSGGLCKLPDNIIVARLISSHENSQAERLCVICRLHDVEHESWGQCVDCADKMCRDCSEKHTFTRQTAKHTVLSFEEINKDPAVLMDMKTNITYCKNHIDREALLFCMNCLMSLCKSCVLTKHSLHETKEIGLVEAETNVTLHKCMKSVEDACECYLVDNSNEAANVIDEKEKKAMKDLTDSKRCILSAVEMKFDKYFKELKDHFNIKRRKYCTHRSAAILRRQESAEAFIDAVKFLLSQGQVDEIAKLESVITSRAYDIEEFIAKVYPKLTHNHNSWPTALINRKDIQLVDTLNFAFIKIEHKKETEGKKLERDIFIENGEIRMNLGNTGKQNEMLNEFVGADKQHRVPLLSSPYPNIECVQRKDQEDKKRGSLLGEYPGPMHSCVDNRSNNMSYSHNALQGQCVLSVVQHNSQSFKHMVQHMNGNNGVYGFNLLQTQHHTKRQSHNVKTKAESKDSRVVNMTPSFENVNLKLHSHVAVKCMVDKKAPDIVDLCFLSNGNFSLVDARNLRLKAFTTAGKFLNFIDDPGPLSVTCCANHLIWNSQNSSIKLYDLCAERIVRVKKLHGTSPHALTSFNDMKYLISSSGKIEACCIDGYTAHVIEPHDHDGNTLHRISHIATRSHDQLVIVDIQQNKVIVNNFDGNCIGEFYSRDFIPGGVCITEHNYIFVTDRRSNKLILLSHNGKFIKEWKTNINSPSCVTCNGKGLLVVGGDDSHVSVYMY